MRRQRRRRFNPLHRRTANHLDAIGALNRNVLQSRNCLLQSIGRQRAREQPLLDCLLLRREGVQRAVDRHDQGGHDVLPMDACPIKHAVLHGQHLRSRLLCMCVVERERTLRHALRVDQVLVALHPLSMLRSQTDQVPQAARSV